MPAHVMLRTVDRLTLAPSAALRRRLAVTVHEIAGPAGLLAFRGSDTHVHVLVLEDRAQTGRTIQALASALRWRLGVRSPFEPARVEPVETQSHLESAFDYILRQDEHHGFENDPFHDASVLPDLLGLRVLGADLVARVREHVPRADRRRWVGHLGVDTLDPGTDASLAIESAAAAVGRADVGGKERVAVAARRAIMEAVGDVPALRHLLGVGYSSLSRLRALAPDPALVRAIRLQMGFREALRARVTGDSSRSRAG